MRFWQIFVLALGLAMDATAVSASCGIAARELRPRHYLLVALYLGGSQALMPLGGWYIGASAGDGFARWAHWIAFVLLGGIGAKMLYEGMRADGAEALVPGDPFSMKLMLPLAIATSVDALVAGVTLPLLGAPLLLSIATIGLVTAALAAGGLAAGRHFGAMLGRRLDAFGGVVLILLGVKILVEHLVWPPR